MTTIPKTYTNIAKICKNPVFTPELSPVPRVERSPAASCWHVPVGLESPSPTRSGAEWCLQQACYISSAPWPRAANDFHWKLGKKTHICVFVRGWNCQFIDSKGFEPFHTYICWKSKLSDGFSEASGSLSVMDLVFNACRLTSHLSRNKLPEATAWSNAKEGQQHKSQDQGSTRNRQWIITCSLFELLLRS